MPYSATVYNIMIASPGDVATERDIVRALLHEWNDLNAQKEHLVLLPIGWETHSAPSMEATAQAIINRQVLQRSDVLIGIFWTRIGTATKEAISGTVEEIERHIASGRHALLYFSDAPVQPSKLNHEQYDAVQEFRQECQARGLYAVYDSTDDFRNKLRKHLALTIQQQPVFQTSTTVQLPAAPSTIPVTSTDNDLTLEARELLVAAVEQNLSIIKSHTITGPKVNVGEQQFVKTGDNRSAAVWEEALEILLLHKLVKPVSYRGDVYDVTAAGYRLAETLIASKTNMPPTP